MRDVETVKKLPVGVRHLADNLAVPEFDQAALRLKRHILLCGCQKLVYPYWVEKVDKKTGEIKKRTEFRVSICGRQPVDDEVALYQNESAVGYSGVMRCGNVWACPICCAKVMRLRSEQIGQLFDSVHKNRGSAVMITYTAGHSLRDPLLDLMDSFKKAKRTLTQKRQHTHLVANRIGAISATEITYNNKNGWHPHQHDVWFFDTPTPPDCEKLADELFPIWQQSCAKHGLKTIAAYRGHRVGVDVRPAWNASEYLAKFDRERSWSLSAEITAGRLKTSQGGSLTPWALLEDAIIRGHGSQSAKLWIEYLRATKGRAVISLMAARNLLKQHNLPTKLDDFADANKVGEGEVITKITASEFDRAVRAGGLGSLLEAARNQGAKGVFESLRTDMFIPKPIGE